MLGQIDVSILSARGGGLCKEVDIGNLNLCHQGCIIPHPLRWDGMKSNAGMFMVY